MATSYERWSLIEDPKSGESSIVPAEYAGDRPRGWTAKDLGEGWGAHLSAPGYMDQTEWDAPHKTEAEAVAAVDSTFNLCPNCHDNHEGDDCGETS